MSDSTSDAARLKWLILGTIKDFISDFLWYDRKEDEELPRGTIEKAVKDGVVTKEEIVDVFREELFEHLEEI